MANFIRGINGFDNEPTGVLQTKKFWVQRDSVAGASIGSGGVFGGNSLQFTNNGLASAVTLERLIPQILQLQRNNSAPGGTGIFAASFWFIPGTTQISNTPILSIGDATSKYDLLGYGNSGNGVLYFPSNFNNIQDNPVVFNLPNASPVWITVSFAYWPTGNVFASYSINNYFRKSNFQLSWNSDVLTGGGYVDRFKFSQGSYEYTIDDLVLQAVISSDPNWPVSVGDNPQPANIGHLGPQRIDTATATANGAVTSWEPSSGSNYQAATGSSSYVLTDSEANGVDLYQWQVRSDAADIKAVQISGVATMPAMVTSIASNDGTVGAIRNLSTDYAPQGFESVAETDGTNPWTAANINAAQFGMKG